MARKVRKQAQAQPKPVYQPTRDELTIATDFLERRRARVNLRVIQDKDGALSADHCDKLFGKVLLRAGIGATDECFYDGLITQLAQASSAGGKLDERGLNFMLSVIRDIKPRDQLETMLAAQMAAVHMAAMKLAAQLANARTTLEQEAMERAASKMLRTFTTQMEALKRYRISGEQKVTVQHVSVGEGGQAIVGNVSQAPRDAAPAKAGGPLALTDASSTAMPIIEKAKQKVVVSKRQE
jgi:hypothetical protein